MTLRLYLRSVGRAGAYCHHGSTYFTYAFSPFGSGSHNGGIKASAGATFDNLQFCGRAI
jgi:hypothetical protein